MLYDAIQSYLGVKSGSGLLFADSFTREVNSILSGINESTSGLVPDLDVSGLGDRERLAAISEHIDLLKDRRDEFRSDQQAYRVLTEAIREFSKEEEKLRVQLRPGGPRGSGDDEESFVAGSLAFLRKQVKDAKDSLDKTGPAGQEKFLKDLERAEELLKNAEDRLDALRKRTPKELLEDKKFQLDEERRAKEAQIAEEISQEEYRAAVIKLVRAEFRLKELEAEKAMLEEVGDVTDSTYSGVLDNILESKEAIIAANDVIQQNIRNYYSAEFFEGVAAGYKELYGEGEKYEKAIAILKDKARISELERDLAGVKLVGQARIDAEIELQNLRKGVQRSTNELDDTDFQLELAKELLRIDAEYYEQKEALEYQFEQRRLEQEIANEVDAKKRIELELELHELRMSHEDEIAFRRREQLDQLIADFQLYADEAAGILGGIIGLQDAQSEAYLKRMSLSKGALSRSFLQKRKHWRKKRPVKERI